jgi:TPR repeat protein
MKLIPIFLLVGMLAVSGWAEEYKLEPYSPELVKKAEAGDPKAQSLLGCCYLDGKGVAVDFSQAYMWFTKSAEQGNASGQNGLGCCYHAGEGVAQDHKEAVKWYRKSAEQGYGEAQRALGSCYKNGWGVGKDEEEALKWYTKAAEQGYETSKDETSKGMLERGRERLERLKSK